MIKELTFLEAVESAKDDLVPKSMNKLANVHLVVDENGRVYLHDGSKEIEFSYHDIMDKWYIEVPEKTLSDKIKESVDLGAECSCIKVNDVKTALRIFLESLPEDGFQDRQKKAREIFGDDLI